MDSESGDESLAGTVTNLLRAARLGTREPMERLFSVVLTELKSIARGQLRSHAPGDLHATALVNAACVRLLGRGHIEAEDRRHFFFLFGRAMRDVLVEQARAARAARRGGGRTLLRIDDEPDRHTETDLDVLELHEALDDLARRDAGAARVVILRFFSGRTLREITEIEERSLDSVRRDWEYARAWLHSRMHER